jgi:hypothetical protein
MVQLSDTIGQDEGMVVAQRVDAGAEADVARLGRHGGDEQLGRRDDFVSGGVVLADPGFVVAEFIEMLDEAHVAFERQRRVFADGMKGRDETAEAEISRLLDTH